MALPFPVSEADRLRMLVIENKGSVSLASAMVEEADGVVEAYVNLRHPTLHTRDTAVEPETGLFFTELSSRLEETISKAEAYVQWCKEHLVRQMAAHRQAISAFRAAYHAQSAVYRIPSEVLGLIFVHAEVSEPFTPFVALAVSQVSSQWRNAALDTPTLWASLSLDVGQVHLRIMRSDRKEKILRLPKPREEYDCDYTDDESEGAIVDLTTYRVPVRGLFRVDDVERWLERAKSRPLTVHVHSNVEVESKHSKRTLFPEWRFGLKYWVELIARLQPRCGAIVVHDMVPHEVIGRLLKGDCGALHELHLKSSHLAPRPTFVTSVDPPPPVALLNAPNLHTLSFWDQKTTMDWSLLPRLTSLSISEAAFVTALFHGYPVEDLCVQLESLTIRRCKQLDQSRFDSRAVWGSKLFYFPSLDSLTVKILEYSDESLERALHSHIVMPNLRTLRIWDESTVWRRNINESVRNILQRKAMFGTPLLRELYLEGVCVCPELFVRLLAHTPQLETLSIMRGTSKSTRNIRKFVRHLRHLRKAMGRDNIRFLPKLRRLEFSSFKHPHRLARRKLRGPIGRSKRHIGRAETMYGSTYPRLPFKQKGYWPEVGIKGLRGVQKGVLVYTRKNGPHVHSTPLPRPNWHSEHDTDDDDDDSDSIDSDDRYRYSDDEYNHWY